MGAEKDEALHVLSSASWELMNVAETSLK